MSREIWPQNGLHSQGQMLKLNNLQRHGFPSGASSFDIDPVQKIVAIGTRSGVVRIFGAKGVDVTFEHPTPVELTSTIFIINKGLLVTVGDGQSLYLWDLRPVKPVLLHTLRFTERVSHIYSPVDSEWLYVGTEKGNIHIVQLLNFLLSSYTIHWNKAIELSCRSRPGKICQIEENPTDSNKLLIGFESGYLVSWNISEKIAETRYRCHAELTCIFWHHEGKQFMTGHRDGQIAIWNVRSTEPTAKFNPHQDEKESEADRVRSGSKFTAIEQVAWYGKSNSDSLIILLGGVPIHSDNHERNLVTVVRGSNVSMLELDYKIIAMEAIMKSPWTSENEPPKSLMILLDRDWVTIDLDAAKEFALIRNPHAVDIHESPITALKYIADEKSILTKLLLQSASTSPVMESVRNDSSSWPLDGGLPSDVEERQSELLIMGHESGSLKFWVHNSSSMTPLKAKINTAELFDPQSISALNDTDCEEPLAIMSIEVCLHTQTFAICGAAGHVLVFNFDNCVLEKVTSMARVTIDTVFGGHQFDGSNYDSGTEGRCHLMLDSNLQQQSGFQLVAALECLESDDDLAKIFSLSMNTHWGIVVVGTTNGVIVFDYIQRKKILAMSTADLQTSIDGRASRSKSQGLTDIIELDSQKSTDSESTKPQSSPNAKRGWRTSKILGSWKSSMSSGKSSMVSSINTSMASSDGSFSIATSIDDHLGHSCNRLNSIYDDNLLVESGDAINCLETCITPERKGSGGPTIWLGFQSGKVMSLSLSVPSSGNRSCIPLICTPTGFNLSLRSPLVSILFFESDRIISCTNAQNKLPDAEKFFTILAAERQIKVISARNNKDVNTTPEDTGLLYKVQGVIVGNTSYLACFSTAGAILFYSLPGLKLLLNVSYLPRVNQRILSTISFINNGRGAYLMSPYEIQRFCYTEEAFEEQSRCQPTLIRELVLRDRPSTSFFGSIFSSRTSSTDRNELFGEIKSSSQIATHIPGEPEKQSSILSGEFAKLRQNAWKRQENLQQCSDDTEKMKESASQFHSSTKQLKEKFKGKKWWN